MTKISCYTCCGAGYHIIREDPDWPDLPFSPYELKVRKPCRACDGTGKISIEEYEEDMADQRRWHHRNEA